MPRRRSPASLPALLVTALGCASSAAQPSACPRGIDEVLAHPGLLREQADAALAADDPELAYRYLALIDTLHPESAESRELFPAAAKLFKRAYLRHRIRQPDSVWPTSEPAFMFQWLSGFFREAEAFPQQPVDTLFIGMPVTFWDEFSVYASAHPKAFSHWEMRVADDNGRIQSVTATPRSARGSPPGSRG